MSKEKKKMPPNLMDGHFMKMIKKYGVGNDFAVARTWVLIVPTVLLWLIPVINKYYGFLEGHFARAVFILVIGATSGLFLKNVLYRCLGEHREKFLKEIFPVETISVLKTPFTDGLLRKNMRWVFTAWIFCFLVVWIYSAVIDYSAIDFDLGVEAAGRVLLGMFPFFFFCFGWGAISFFVALTIDYFRLNK